MGASSGSRGASMTLSDPFSTAKSESWGSSSGLISTAGSGAAANRSTRSRSRAPFRSISAGPPVASSSSFASSRERTQPIGVESSPVRSGSIEPDTISRSIARVMAT